MWMIKKTSWAFFQNGPMSRDHDFRHFPGNCKMNFLKVQMISALERAQNFMQNSYKKQLLKISTEILHF